MARTGPRSPRRPRLLVLELWGLGDLTIATTLLRAASATWDVTVVAKGYAEALLQPSFPEIEFIPFDAPWTVHRGKYRFHRWPWAALVRLVSQLRRRHFEAGVSVRADPRDHLLLSLAGVRRRLGFARMGSHLLLSESVRRRAARQHRVEDWQELSTALALEGSGTASPWLDAGRYRTPRVEEIFGGMTKPVVCFHLGARIPVRRWPVTYYQEIARRLRTEFDFHLVVIPDDDGYGRELAPEADTVLTGLSIAEFVDVVGRIDLLLGNDSGPAHIAASCGRPTVSFFGPMDPIFFRPWGERQHVIIRDICPLRPCFDYCAFPEPYCLTKLLPGEIWTELREQLLLWVEQGILPARLRLAPVAARQ